VRAELAHTFILVKELFFVDWHQRCCIWLVRSYNL